MTFISFEFVLFFIVCYAVYFLISSKWKWLWLLSCSYFFYGYHSLIYVPLLLLSTAIDYWVGIKIGHSEHRSSKKNWLYVSIIVNLGLLGFFKYFNFFSHEFQVVTNQLNVDLGFLQNDFLLPLGISFYTFQTLGYSIDVYRGYIKPETHFGRYALYVSFFPQLVAGPIEKARKLLPQLHLRADFDYQRTVEGCQLILWGVFKKVVIADRLGIYVNQVFDVSNQHHGPAVIIGTFFFALQILFDFAAYSEIAIGLARILGVNLSRNFGNSCFYESPTDMWSQWHITLTAWFREYVYFPLTKLSKSSWTLHLALFITFLITGLWHGASWGFVIWGGLNGIYLVFDHLTAKGRKRLNEKIGLDKHPNLLGLIGILIFLPFNMFSAVFFRASSVSDALVLLERFFDWSSGYVEIEPFGSFQLFYMTLIVGLVMCVNRGMGKRQIHDYLGEKSVQFRWFFYFMLIQAILFLRVTAMEKSSFIYFEF